MTRPLVTIITPTWNRPDLLAETIEHVRLQDYPNLEHVIVSDGQDDRLEDMMIEDTAEWYGHQDLRGEYPVRWHSLGRNWSGLMPASFGIAPLTVGYLMARGEYVLPWCDDERALRTDHISRLVDLLEAENVDFAYPKVKIWRAGDPDGPETAIIGTDPPEYGQITHFLARTSNFHRFGMPRWGTHPVDWSLISDWLAAGATWAFLPECTFDHRLDQI
jgi:glycosyltransferase involved in cell wall biosynthesis